MAGKPLAIFKSTGSAPLIPARRAGIRGAKKERILAGNPTPWAVVTQFGCEDASESAIERFFGDPAIAAERPAENGDSSLFFLKK